MRLLLLLSLVAIGLLAGAGGCTSVPYFNAAECVRFKHRGYNCLACDDRAVGEHCAKVLLRQKANRDDGLSFTENPYLPRACTVYYRWSKPAIFVGKSFMSCVNHEIAHIEHPGEAKWVAEHFPCVEDVRR